MVSYGLGRRLPAGIALLRLAANSSRKFDPFSNVEACAFLYRAALSGIFYTASSFKVNCTRIHSVVGAFTNAVQQNPKIT